MYNSGLTVTYSQVENAQLTAARNSEFANAAREELMETQKRVDTLVSQVNQYQTQVLSLFV